MKFADLNLHLNTDVNTIEINNNIINILHYLPIEEKNNIIQLTLQNSEENGVYNLLKIKMFFGLYLVYSYSDIDFTLDDKSNSTELYDILVSNNIFHAIIDAIPPHEKDILYQLLMKTMEHNMAYKSTVASVIHDFLDNIVPNAEKAADILKDFNPDMFKQVINFAQAANGGRSIQ